MQAKDIAHFSLLGTYVALLSNMSLGIINENTCGRHEVLETELLANKFSPVSTFGFSNERV